MKVLAGRRRDAEDIGFLVKHLHLSNAQEVLTLCAEISSEACSGGRVCDQ
jgi:hypothetical protein